MRWQTSRLIDWARMIPSFDLLSLHDQAILIHSGRSKIIVLVLGWRELILADVAFRSSRDTLMLWPERPMSSTEAARCGCSFLFSRILTELAAKMREIVMDRMELGALRLIVLFDPSNCTNSSTTNLLRRSGPGEPDGGDLAQDACVSVSGRVLPNRTQ